MGVFVAAACTEISENLRDFNPQALVYVAVKVLFPAQGNIVDFREVNWKPFGRSSSSKPPVNGCGPGFTVEEVEGHRRVAGLLPCPVLIDIRKHAGRWRCIGGIGVFNGRHGVLVFVGVFVGVDVCGIIWNRVYLGVVYARRPELYRYGPVLGDILLNTSSMALFAPPAEEYRSKLVSTCVPLMDTLNTLFPVAVQYVSAILNVNWYVPAGTLKVYVNGLP